MYVFHNYCSSIHEKSGSFQLKFIWCQIISSLQGIYESKFRPFCIHGCQCLGKILGIMSQDLSVPKPIGYMLTSFILFVKLMDIL